VPGTKGSALLRSSFPQTLALAGPLEKTVGLASNPFQKSRHTGVQPQRIHLLIVTFKFRLGEQCMDLAMTDSMKPDRFDPATRTRKEMVRVTLRHRYGTVTEWTDPLFIGRRHGQTGVGQGLLAFDSA
jgi:hypothetical protein